MDEIYNHLGQAFIALIAGMAAYFAAKAKKEATQANAAVNHADSDELRLYDLVADTHKKTKELERRQLHVLDTLLTRPCVANDEACDYLRNLYQRKKDIPK